MKMHAGLKDKVRLFLFPCKILLKATGIKPYSVKRNLLVELPIYIRNLIAYNETISPKLSFRPKLINLSPCFGDRYSSAGIASSEYFYQDLWMAQKIFTAKPSEHWDIGSRIDGFVAHLLTFRTVNVIDIRKLESEIPGLNFHQGDVTELQIPDNSIESLSCLHAVEHVGLGRYGDPIDPLGCFKGMQELQRVLTPGGKLYFSVPIGRERVEFDSHRVFDPLTVLETFSSLKLISFAVINQTGDLVAPAQWEDFRNIDYACGLFILTKPILRELKTT